MIFNRYLFLGQSVAGKSGRKIRKMTTENLSPGSYLLVLPETDRLVLEIIPAAVTKIKAYRDQDMRIVGIAGSKEEAASLAASVTAEVFRATGGTDILAYLEGYSEEAS